MAAWISTHGEKAFQAAVSGGQYTHADGMFYGGSHPSWSNACLRAVLRAQATPRQRLGWIDFHTGLGPRGHGEKIYSGRNDPAAIARTKAWWGDDVTSFFDGSSTSAHVTGIISDAAYTECPNTELTAMALEYGTYPLEHTLQALTIPMPPPRSTKVSNVLFAIASISTPTTGRRRSASRRRRPASKLSPHSRRRRFILSH